MHTVTITIKEHIEPMDRGSRYEDPLSEFMTEKSLGTIEGGGTSFETADGFRIRSVDLEARVVDADSSIPLMIHILESCGAPVGSFITFEGRQIDFGKSEGVTLTLDGCNLPSEVYEKYGLDEIIAEIEAALPKDIGEFHAYNALAEVTELYLYGESADKIIERLTPMLNSFPLCKNAKIEKIG